jgi:hypothetical protein
LLREGDISSAEFAAIVTGTELVRGETPQTYAPFKSNSVQYCHALFVVAALDAARDVDPDTDAVMAEELRAVQEAIKVVPDLTPDDGDACNDIRAVGQYRKQVYAAQEVLARRSRAIGVVFKNACNSDGSTGPFPSIEDTIAQIDAALAVARDLPGEREDTASAVAALEAWRTDLSARSRSSDVMVQEAIRLAQERSGSIAMIVGAAHTAAVEKGLLEKGIAYAVLAPNALTDPSPEDDLYLGEVARKSDAAPVLQSFVNALLAGKRAISPECLERVERKPKSVLERPEPWVQRKADAYGLMYDYASTIFAERPVEPSRFTLPTVSIDHSQASIRRGDGGTISSVAFPITLVDPQGDRHTSWVVVERVNAFVAMTDLSQLERELLLDLEGGGGGRGKPPEARSSGEEGQPPRKPARLERQRDRDSMQLGVEFRAKSFPAQDEAIAYQNHRAE